MSTRVDRPGRRWGRMLVPIAFLAGGVGLSLAVATACALWSPLARLRLVRTMGHWPAPMPADVDPRPTMVCGSASFGRALYQAVGVYEEGRIAISQSAVVAGWPCFALSASARADGLAAPDSPIVPWSRRHEPVYRIPASVQASLKMHHGEVPLRPLWGGLVLNGLLYAVCLAIPAALVRAARRAGRRCSGRCIACGYDRRGAAGACPECGFDAPLPHRMPG